MRRLWIVVGSLATVAAVGFATLNMVMLVAHEEVTEHATFDATDITALDLHTDNGTIEIVGDDVDEITLEAEISHGLRPTTHRTAVEGDTLVVRSDCHFAMSYWCSTSYRLVVPRDLAVTASSNNGRVTVIDLTGTVDVDSDNGRLELIRLTGPVEATSDNGRVEGSGLRSTSVTATTSNGSVSLTFAAAPRTVVARTHNGSVEVVLPEGDASYRVETDTDHGSIDAAVRTDPASDRTVVASTHNGSVRVRYPTG
jgi:hypothetical protein